MSNKTIWISIRAIKLHEFHSTLRIVGKSTDWSTGFIKLSEVQSGAIASFLKICSPLLLAYLVLNSLNSGFEISLTIQTVTASIPTAYFTVVCSLIYLFATLSLVHLLMTMTIRARWVANGFVHGFSGSMYGVLTGHDETALALPIFNNSFFTEKFHTSAFLTILLAVALFGLVIPFVALGCFLTQVQVAVALNGSTSFFEKIAAIFGIFLIASTAIYAVLFHIPLPMRKNVFRIRYGFLCSVSASFPHPRIEHWLHDDP